VLALVDPVAKGPSRSVQAAWQQRLKRARSLYAEKAAIRKELLSERRDPVWPINLAPDPDGRFALHQALQEESAARTEYMRILRIFDELMREGTLPDEDSGLFLVSREMVGNAGRNSIGQEAVQALRHGRRRPRNSVPGDGRPAIDCQNSLGEAVRS
jgi:hypothetical protein